MKHPMILTVGLCLLLTSVSAAADQTADEAAVWAAWERAVAAFNDHNPEAMSANFDKVYETWTGHRKGVKPFVDYYTEWFKHQTKIKGEIVEKIGVVFVTPDVAIAKARVKFTGRLDEKGEPLPEQHRLQAEVMVKKDGKWLRAAAFLRPVEE